MTHKNRDHAEMAIRLAAKFADAAERGRHQLAGTRKQFVRDCLLDEIACNDRDRDFWIGEWCRDVAKDAGVPWPEPSDTRPAPPVQRGNAKHDPRMTDDLPYGAGDDNLMHYVSRDDAPGLGFRSRTYDPHGEESEL